MKKTCALLISFGFITLYWLTSCAPVMKTVEEPEMIESTAETTEDTTGEMASSPLGDLHETSGMECADCHSEDPPAELVPTAVCLSCHEEYSTSEPSVESWFPDPHNAHVVYPDCFNCHHVHSPSEDQCSTCHYDLGFDIP